MRLCYIGCMTKLTLSSQQIAELKIAHKTAKTKRDADRIKTILLLDKGWSPVQIANVLLLDDETIRNYIKLYESDGMESLLKNNYKGFIGKLSDEEIMLLDNHLQKEIYLKVQDIIVYVKKVFKVEYSVSGMNELLHRMKYVYKKPKIVPGKANGKAQESFLRSYESLKESKEKDDPIYFMDGAHPQHNPVPAFGWIKKGVTKEIKSNTGRQRVNINGAINAENQKMSVQFGDSINAQSTIFLFKKLEAANKNAGVIYVICDNAKYYRSNLVQNHIKNSKIKLIFLPPYSPNLNLIERVWKFFKKKVLYNQYYETFEEFKRTSKAFFKNVKRYRKELSSLLMDNFQICDAQNT